MNTPSSVPMFFASALLAVTTAGCGALASLLPGSASAAGVNEPTANYATESSGESHASSYSRSSSVEEINGVPVNAHSAGDDATPQQTRGGGEFGATCTEMNDCASRLCFIGRRGNVGFCTQTCESWSDCPSHWECQRPSNAAQNVCMPARDD
jgi:hypothetical protein